MEPPAVISYQDRLKQIIEKPTFVADVFAHVANGGDLITLSQNLDIRYSDLRLWFMADGERCKMLAQADDCRREWVKQRVLMELGHIALVDLRQAFNADGSLKPPADWPENIARALAGVETDELFEGTGKDRAQIGHTKKIRLHGKVEALKLIGAEFGLFVQKHKVEVVDKLEDLVAGSFQPITNGIADDTSAK